MEEISSFRGLSGEVVRCFLRFQTFLTSIPVLGFWIIFGICLYVVGNRLPGFMLLFLVMAASSFLVGRFAIPASRGELDAGFWSPNIDAGESLQFVLRYCIYTLLWTIPVTLIAYFGFNQQSLLTMFMYGNFNFLSAGFHGLLMALIILAFIFGPTLSCILSTYTVSIAEIFSPEPLSWLYHERRGDLGSFFASLIGGMIKFWAKYIIPLLIIALIAAKISSNFGMAVATFIYALPWLLAPVLICRLTGAFITGGLSMEEEVDNDIEMLGSNDPAVVKAAAQNIAEKAGVPDLSVSKDSYNATLAKLNELTSIQLQEAIDKAKLAPVNAYSLLELSYLYKQSGNTSDAVKKASEAITAAFNEGLNVEALQLFKFFSKERSQLKIAPNPMQALATNLLKHKYFMDAAWCYLTLIASAVEEQKLDFQKKFVHVAEQAQKMKNLK